MSKESSVGEERFVQVASAVGRTQADIIVEYLRAEGIRAYSWGEGAGSALGLTIGLLGDIRIMVPEEEEEEALALLEAEVTDEELEDDDLPESGSNLRKAILGGMAVTMSPIGAGVALGMSYFMGSDPDDVESRIVDCPHCGSSLELSLEEAEQGWYTCPECDNVSSVPVLSRCPTCEAEVELNEDEVTQRRYQCPECGEDVQLK